MLAGASLLNKPPALTINRPTQGTNIPNQNFGTGFLSPGANRTNLFSPTNANNRSRNNLLRNFGSDGGFSGDEAKYASDDGLGNLLNLDTNFQRRNNN